MCFIHIKTILFKLHFQLYGHNLLRPHHFQVRTYASLGASCLLYAFTRTSYYVPLHGFLIMRLYRGYSLIMCFYESLLSYLFFRSAKFYLCSPLSGNYVLELIGLPHFKHILDSFTNCHIRTSM